MAYVEKYTRTYASGSTATRWRARYRDPTGRERSRTFNRRIDAERYLTQVESDFIRYRWRPAVHAAGLPAGLTPHELRHTAASLLIANGAGPKSVQVQLGHSTITTTFDVYGHLFEGHLDDVMDRLDAEWRQASA